jgi:hypothetical protein
VCLERSERIRSITAGPAASAARRSTLAAALQTANVDSHEERASQAIVRSDDTAHKSGDHTVSMKAAADAKELLGIE